VPEIIDILIVKIEPSFCVNVSWSEVSGAFQVRLATGISVSPVPDHITH
jgi:hypothetical protein